MVVTIGLDFKAWHHRRWSAHAQTSIVFGFPLRKHLHIESLELKGAPLQPEPRHRQRADYRRDRSGTFNAHVQFGLGLQYQIKPRLVILAAPQTAYRLNQSLQNGWAKQRLSSTGVHFGIGLSI